MAQVESGIGERKEIWNSGAELPHAKTIGEGKPERAFIFLCFSIDIRSLQAAAISLIRPSE